MRRVEIPKPNGGMRKLGIPIVLDRVIQQAMVQVLEYMNDGYDWIVDIDLEKFFDNVPHDRLLRLNQRHRLKIWLSVVIRKMKPVD